MGGGMGGALREPGNKLLMAVAMFMQASNIADSVAPGFIPEEIKMWIAQSMEQAPAMAEQLARQGNPMQMLQAVGNSAAPGAAPMGLSAMGRGGMQPGAGAAGPPVLPGGGQY